MLFGVVDVTSLVAFLNSLLPALGSIDPVVAGGGAVILFVVQKAFGGNFSLWGTIKSVLTMFAPKSPATPVDPGVPVSDSQPPLFNADDFATHEIEAVKTVIDKIRAARDATSVADKAKLLLDAVVRAIPAK